MMLLKIRTIISPLILLLVIGLSACGPSPEELAATSSAETAAAATSTYTITPTPTITPIPPTATLTPFPTKEPTPTREPLAGAIPEGFEVTFTKSFSGKCQILGPEELVVGEYSFVLALENPRSGDWMDLGFLRLSYLVDGKTTQDLLDHPNMKNGTWWGDAFSLFVDAKPTDGTINELRKEKYYTYSLTEGEIVVMRWTQNPHFFWYCGTIQVK